MKKMLSVVWHGGPSIVPAGIETAIMGTNKALNFFLQSYLLELKHKNLTQDIKPILPSIVPAGIETRRANWHYAGAEGPSIVPAGIETLLRWP